MKLSIIVPIYNVEKYLNRCLESIKSALCDDVEVLLIDDGSTDSSSELANKFASKNKGFYYFKKENGGLSDARNYGIKMASGDFVWFIDSDDYVPVDAVRIIRQANLNNPECDVFCFSATKILENKNKLIKYTVKEKCSGLSFLNTQYRRHTMQPEVWHSVFRMDLIKNNNLYFKKGIYHEDEEWTPKVLAFSNCVFSSNDSIYYYEVRSNSIMTSNKFEKRLLNLYCVAKEYSASNYIDKKTKKLIIDRLISLFLSVYGQSGDKNIYRKNKGDYIFFLKNAYFIQTKIKVIVFLLNKSLFLKISKLRNRRG